MAKLSNGTQAGIEREIDETNSVYESIQFVPINLVNVTIKVSRKRQRTPK